MAIIQKTQKIRNPTHGMVYKIGLLVLTGILAFFALISSLTIHPSTYFLSIGDVAPQDVRAPHNLTYVSTLLTEKARLEAEHSVLPVYLPADPVISRKQIEKLRVVLYFIVDVRQDAFATMNEKLSDLSAITDIKLDSATARQVLELDDNQWQDTQQESLRVLEQIMRNSIKEEQLPEIQRGVTTYISFALSDNQFNIVTQFITPLITANSFYSEELTNSARQTARDSISPVTISYVQDQTIINQGQVISNVIMEAIQEFGLFQAQNNPSLLFSPIILVLLAGVFFCLYIRYSNIKALEEIRRLTIISLLFLAFLFSARLIVPGQEFLAYFFPISAFGLTISVLFSTEMGLILSLILGILTAYGLTNSLSLTLFYIFPSLCGILVLGKGRRISDFFAAGLAIGGSGAAVILAYRFSSLYTNWLILATFIGASILNGIASASLALLFQYIFSQILGITTPLRLLDISRPDHPLLQFLLLNAPGTYQHSLQVANLAEQAAKGIKGDALLVRVGALYHDVGKALNPLYFIENQLQGSTNPHDDLDCEASSLIIVKHVTDGITLAKKHRLPPRIQDFILEHHGSLITSYQYAKAVKLAGGDPALVNPAKYRYPGFPPRSRETAILMIADGVEARVRAMIPNGEEELRSIIKKTVNYLNCENQLSNSPLTFGELEFITESFVSTLMNTRHIRIQYPEITPKASQKSLLETSIIDTIVDSSKPLN